MHSVLIVEDNELILKSIELILTREKFEIATASNGEEAMEWLDNMNFDLVITDMIMPLADGMRVLRHIKDDPAKEHTGVIVISSVARERMILEAFDLRADDYISKPVMPFELLLRVKKVLAEKAVERQLKAEYGDNWQEDMNAELY